MWSTKNKHAVVQDSCGSLKTNKNERVPQLFTVKLSNRTPCAVPKEKEFFVPLDCLFCSHSLRSLARARKWSRRCFCQVYRWIAVFFLFKFSTILGQNRYAPYHFPFVTRSPSSYSFVLVSCPGCTFPANFRLNPFSRLTRHLAGTNSQQDHHKCPTQSSVKKKRRKLKSINCQYLNFHFRKKNLSISTSHFYQISGLCEIFSFR